YKVFETARLTYESLLHKNQVSAYSREIRSPRPACPHQLDLIAFFGKKLNASRSSHSFSLLAILTVGFYSRTLYVIVPIHLNHYMTTLKLFWIRGTSLGLRRKTWLF